MTKNERNWFFNSCHEINILVDFSCFARLKLATEETKYKIRFISEYYQICHDHVTHSLLKKHFSHGLEYKCR